MLAFLKKHWFLILLAFIATLVVLAKIFLTKEKKVEAPPPYNKPLVEWNGVVPGQTNNEQVKEKLGEPETALPAEGDNIKFLYPRQGGGPEHEVIFEGATVALIKDRVLDGNISSFHKKYGPPEADFWGEHQKSGFKTYIWASKGVAVIAHSEEGLIYEVWYFQPMPLQQFLATWGRNLSSEPSEGGY